MERVVCIVIGYAFGLIQTAYIIGKIKGIDIREHGSGNAGTTNMMRVLGKKAGFITGFVDVLKCILAVIIIMGIYRGNECLDLLKIYAAAGVMLGHDFPFYMNFRGGKGVAVTAGMVIAFGDMRLILIGILCFFLPAYLSHHISVGSLCLASSFLIGIIVLGQMGTFGLGPSQLTEMYLITAGMTALTFYQHRENIVRLINGTESKVWVKKE